MTLRNVGSQNHGGSSVPLLSFHIVRSCTYAVKTPELQRITSVHPITNSAVEPSGIIWLRGLVVALA